MDTASGASVCVHCEQTVMTPLYKVKARRANLQKQKPGVARDSRAIPQHSTNLAQILLEFDVLMGIAIFRVV